MVLSAALPTITSQLSPVKGSQARHNFNKLVTSLPWREATSVVFPRQLKLKWLTGTFILQPLVNHLLFIPQTR